MHNARPQTVARALALALVAAVLTTLAGRATVRADELTTPAGTVISNRAEATYVDQDGTPFGTVSTTVTLTVLSVSSVVVTPDETEPSNTVSPNETITRLFRVCNGGNTPDFYTITRAEVSAPATLKELYYDLDENGVVSPGDRPVQVGAGLSPRLTRGRCVGLLAVVETNSAPQGTRLTIGVTARSNVNDGANGAAQDDGQIVNVYGNGSHFSSPDDPQLPPVKLVENRARVTAAPGQSLNYIVAFRNSGDVPARRAVMRDELPAGLEYVPGTLRLNNRPLTDADDADEGRASGQTLEVRWSEIAVGELVQIAFQARVRGGVQPGTGILNAAVVSADNAPPVTSSSTVAVVNPFGLVYEGRSGGASTIAGARVALLLDRTSGDALQLQHGAGTSPNEQNDNPFTTDAQGRWNFALAAGQLGSASSPARYFLNVTAQGFRTRMLEVTVAPSASAGDALGLFSLTVRSIDGQPIAQNGSFELTDDAVSVENLAAFALNVPMFENQAVEIAKVADRASVEVGDVISYRVEVHNSTSMVLNDVEVSDTLPPSFHYAAGTGRLENPPDAARAVEPVETGIHLTFHVGQIRAGARATLTYRVRVGANAREGEQVNTATARGVFLSGEQVTTPPTHASVRVRRGLFSMQQIILGRVFEDKNGNGKFDDGDKPLPNVRLYLNNGQSVMTDSAGQYNFPSVNDGTVVIALDPVTLPAGYSLADTGTRDAQSWTRLLRTPLGGGSMLHQNFALKFSGKTSAALAANSQSLFTHTDGQGADADRRREDGNKQSEDADGRSENSAGQRENADGQSKYQDGRNENTGKQRKDTHGRSGNAGGQPKDTNGRRENTDEQSKVTDGHGELANGQSELVAGHSTTGVAPLASGTYEMAATEFVEPVAPGGVRIVSPAPDAVVLNAALEVEARVMEGWTVALEVEGARVADSKIGMRRVDRKNQVTTYSFVGISLRPGPNRIKATAVSPSGAAGESTELTAYGRGPAKRLEIFADRNELSAGGRDSTPVRVRAFDQWGHPAADTVVALEATAGRLVAAATDKDATADKNAGASGANANSEATADSKVVGEKIGGEQPGEARQQMLQIVGGEGVAVLVADNQTGAAKVRATTGTVEAEADVRITPEVRPSILVGLAEVSVGKAAPEMELRGDDGGWQSRIGFFYRGRIFGQNLLTLAYDSSRPLNRTAGRDRLFQLDPLERAYPLFGDSSTRYEDAQSNSKLYARLDHGRSYFLFGDFDTENKGLSLAGYARKLTGVKVHVENSEGDFVSVTGARPDTAFARDVLPGGGLALAQLSHGDIMPGSEVVVIEVRDRRNPERIISREPLIRSVDYNLDSANGAIFFLRPVSAFDYQLNLVQVVVTYEHRANSMSSAVYTARAVKTFKSQDLRLGISLVDQQQADFGAFVLGGVDGEKRLPRGGSLQFEYAMSRGQVSFTGNLFGADAAAGNKHNGSAYRVELEQPLPYKDGVLRAGFSRADEGFLNPFGSTVTPGSQRAHVGVDLKVRPSSVVGFEFMDERNHTANVSNRRFTGSLNWSERWNDRFRTTLSYDFRRLNDDLSGRETDSNLITAGAEWQATDKLQLSVKREQNLGDADPTYPDQTTLSATYQWNQWARLFLTQRLASAPIVPISDAAATGFVSTGARRETAVGVETKVGRFTSVNGRYQIENGINGTDSFAVVGLQNRLPIGEKLAIDLGYERGFHLAGAGDSFNSATVGFSYQPTDYFRTSGRYELRDRNGRGSVATLGAAGRLADGLTALVRWQSARTNFYGRRNSSSSAMGALAWRPLKSDRVGLLFSYTHRSIFQEGLGSNVIPGTTENLTSAPATGGATRDRSDLLSTDAYFQATRRLELYGRFAFKFGDTGSPDLARASVLTYLTQGRAVYRLGRYVDMAGEVRVLTQPASATRRTSYGAELGFWVLPDLRLGGGYNLTQASEPEGSNTSILTNGKRGFYFTVSSKLSRLFDLYGVDEDNAQAKEKPKELYPQIQNGTVQP